MKLFCKHAICAECKVLFDPPKPGSVDRMWPNLCETHRKPEREKWERRQRVKQWAEFNFERLEKQMIQEQKEEYEKHSGSRWSSRTCAASARATSSGTRTPDPLMGVGITIAVTLAAIGIDALARELFQ